MQRDYPEAPSGIIHLLKEKLKTGKCLLLLDALDEVPREHRNRLKDKLNRFAQNYPCRIICTSRIVGYDGAFVTRAKEVEIVPFSQKKIEKYIEIWFSNAADYINKDFVSANGLIRELQNKPQIRGLAQNPLLLSLLCSLYQEQELTLPARRCQIYEKAVHCMLSKWTRNRKPQSEGKIRAKIRLLEELAYHFTCEGKEIFSPDDLYDKIEAYLQERNITVFRDTDTDELMMELSEEDGIIQKLPSKDDRYLFLHRTFQEYFTACYLKRAIQKNQSDGIALAREYFWEYEWHETLSLLAGLMQNPVPLLQAITDEKDDIFSTLLLLAGRCIAECPENPHPLIAEIIDRIYKLWQSYPNAGFIKSIVVAIGQVNSQMFKKVQKALEDEDPSIRMKAAKALGEISNLQAEQALIKAVKDEEGKVRMGAAEALGWIGTSKAVEALSEALNDNSGLVRRRAIKALVQISTPKALKALIQAVKHNDDILIKREAKQALRRNNSTKAEKMSITGHNNDSKRVRKRTVSALGGIDNRQRIEALIAALKHENNLVRMWAAQVLGQIGTPEAERELIAALNNDDRFVRSRVAEALVGIGTLPAVEAVIKAVKDKDSSARREATTALGKISNLQAVEVLTTVLNDDDSFVRLNAAKALSLIGTKETLAKLIQLPEIDSCRPDIFSLARTLAVRFSKEKLPFIPVYPKLVAHKQ
jgi:HEAT repeat protein